MNGRTPGKSRDGETAASTPFDAEWLEYDDATRPVTLRNSESPEGLPKSSARSTEVAVDEGEAT